MCCRLFDMDHIILLEVIILRNIYFTLLAVQGVQRAFYHTIMPNSAYSGHSNPLDQSRVSLVYFSIEEMETGSFMHIAQYINNTSIRVPTQ